MTRPRPDCSSLCASGEPCMVTWSGACMAAREQRPTNPLTRWYWMCAEPGQLEFCGRCLRNAARHGPPEAWAPHQRWGTPIVGAHRRTCHDYMPGDPPKERKR